MTIALDVAPPTARAARHDRGFDLAMIGGLFGVAMAAAVLVALNPATVPLVLFADSWLLGYPHVASTFTRLIPDRAAMRQHRFLVFGLPVLVVAATAALAFGLGIWAVATVYFYWQWFHTVRQSWGIAQLYRRRSAQPVPESPMLAEAIFYLVPVWGLVHRLAAAPDHFLFPTLPIAVPPVPAGVETGLAVAAGLALAYWLALRLRQAWDGELPVLYTAFVASHFLIFIIGYVALDDLAGGWVVTNVWHTAQYMMLVWMFNENARIKASGTAAGPYLRLSGNNRPLRYFLLCLLTVFPVYVALNYGLALGGTVVIVAIVLNQTINFHHFIVDSVIWRSRRNPAGAPA